MTTASILRLSVAFFSSKGLLNDIRLQEEADLHEKAAERKRQCLKDLQSTPGELLPLR